MFRYNRCLILTPDNMRTRLLCYIFIFQKPFPIFHVLIPLLLCPRLMCEPRILCEFIFQFLKISPLNMLSIYLFKEKLWLTFIYVRMTINIKMSISSFYCFVRCSILFEWKVAVSLYLNVTNNQIKTTNLLIINTFYCLIWY